MRGRIRARATALRCDGGERSDGRRPGILSLAALCSLALVTTACNGPFLLLPGGALQGPSAPVPSDWSFTDEVSTIQIETNAADPYSINIWAVALDEHLYLHAGGNRANWVEHIETDPLVRARIEGTLYPLRATRVTDQAEFDRFADAYEVKYGSRPRNENLDEIYVYRLGDR